MDLNIYCVDTVDDLTNAEFVNLTGDYGKVGFGFGVSTDDKYSLQLNFSVGSGIGISFGLPEGSKNSYKFNKELSNKYTTIVDKINNSKNSFEKIKNWINLFKNLSIDGFIALPEKEK